MLSIGSKELHQCPSLGKTARCPNCGEQHEVTFGKKRMPDGSWEETKMLASVRCGEKSFLVGIEGKDITLIVEGNDGREN